MNILKSYIYDRPTGVLSNSLLWKYGFLTVILYLLWISLDFLLKEQPPYSAWTLSGPVVPIILLLNHLAAYFWFGPFWSPVVRIASIVWLFVGVVVIAIVCY